MKELAFGIVDAQRGFMPKAEGEILDRAGFGELPVADGQRIIPVVKRLLVAAGSDNVFTTQDWHPHETAHFSDNPDFVTNWPVHCVQNTAGAALHPDLESALMPSVTRFYKGQEKLEHGRDDLSYSGYYSKDSESVTLPDWLAERGTTHVVLGGLALDYCVGKTALDLRAKLGLEVTVVLDATRGIADASTEAMLEAFADAGIRTAQSAELIKDWKDAS